MSHPRCPRHCSEMTQRLAWLARGAAASLLLGCGSAEVGEECGEVRAEGECVEDAVCISDDRGDLVCKREATIGEACSNEGERAECPAAGICGKDTTGGIECLLLCDVKEDCPAGEDCNGVEGTSLKGCRVK